MRDACKSLQISYSTAWRMLDHAEEAAGFPLLSRNRGGKSGQGTHLTEQGRRLMEAYDGFAAEMEQIAQRLYGEYFAEMLD